MLQLTDIFAKLEMKIGNLSQAATQKEDQKLVFKTDYPLMQVISIAEMLPLEHSAILLTFIKLPFIIKIFVLSISEWPLKTGFTVLHDYVRLNPILHEY